MLCLCRQCKVPISKAKLLEERRIKAEKLFEENDLKQFEQDYFRHVSVALYFLCIVFYVQYTYIASFNVLCFFIILYLIHLKRIAHFQVSVALRSYLHCLELGVHSEDIPYRILPIIVNMKNNEALIKIVHVSQWSLFIFNIF